MDSAPILITLDRERAVRWTERAQARNSSLRRPVSFTQLARGRNRLYALCALVWSALVERDHDFDEPEDLAFYFRSEAQQLAALDAIRAMLAEAYPEKKSPGIATSSASAGTSAVSGPAPSSSGALPAPDGTTSSPGSPPPLNSPGRKKSAAKRATKPTS